jgi:hypothetical protein
MNNELAYELENIVTHPEYFLVELRVDAVRNEIDIRVEQLRQQVGEDIDLDAIDRERNYLFEKIDKYARFQTLLLNEETTQEHFKRILSCAQKSIQLQESIHQIKEDFELGITFEPCEHGLGDVQRTSFRGILYSLVNSNEKREDLVDLFMMLEKVNEEDYQKTIDTIIYMGAVVTLTSFLKFGLWMRQLSLAILKFCACNGTDEQAQQIFQGDVLRAMIDMNDMDEFVKRVIPVLYHLASTHLFAHLIDVDKLIDHLISHEASVDRQYLVLCVLEKMCETADVKAIERLRLFIAQR